MSWGYKIIILYSGFVLGILFLVYKCTQEDIDLVTTDYYEKELKFQDRIDRITNKEESGYYLKVNYNEDSRSIDIQFPEIAQKQVKGEIVFFRPDNSKLDFKVELKPENGRQVISAASLAKGFWRMQTTWEADAIPLYQEDKIYLQ